MIPANLSSFVLGARSSDVVAQSTASTRYGSVKSEMSDAVAHQHHVPLTLKLFSRPQLTLHLFKLDLLLFIPPLT